MTTSSDIVRLLEALEFSADKHRRGKRKDEDGTPYINHPMRVCMLLADVGGVKDVKLLQAAILHDTIEDTETIPSELEARFGRRVRKWVEEVSDDKSLPKKVRKRNQIESAASLSRKAQMIRVADKIANLEDITDRPPVDWPAKRKREYGDWTERVVDRCRGCNPTLERKYRVTLDKLRAALGGEATS